MECIQSRFPGAFTNHHNGWDFHGKPSNNEKGAKQLQQNYEITAAIPTNTGRYSKTTHTTDSEMQGNFSEDIPLVPLFVLGLG